MGKINVGVTTFGEGADNISPMMVDLAKIRVEKLIQWERDTFEIARMGGLVPSHGASVIVSLLLNELVRVAQGVGLKREALDEKLTFVWDNLPKHQQEADEQTNSR